jgi:hypothetical protein
MRERVDRIFGIDLRALACFRVLLAGYVLLDLGWRAVDLEAFYTDFGAFPLEAALTFQYVNGAWNFLSPYMYVTSTVGAGMLFLLNALFAIGLLVGWKTRLMNSLCWVMALSLQARNPLLLHSGDVYLRLMLFWGMLLPLGARFSVDGYAAGLVARGKELPQRVLSFATVGVLLQVVFMYWFTVLLKTAPEWRKEFTAVYYALSIEQYAFPLGQFLREIRWLMQPLTLFTLILEIFGPLLALSPIATNRLRLLVVPSFLFFHLIALNTTMNIGLFVYIAAIPWVLFLPTGFWDWLTALWTKLPENPVQQTVLRLRERAIDWRSRRIARQIQQGTPSPRIGLTIAGQLIAAYFIVHGLLINLRGADPNWGQHLPNPPQVITSLTRFDQFWAMFSPRPTVEDGWYVVPAQTVGGRWVDLFRGGQPLADPDPNQWQKPDPMAISRAYPNDRWGKYMMNLWALMYSRYRVYYCRYLDRVWHREHGGADTLQRFDLYFVLKENKPNYQPPSIVPKLLWAYQSPFGGATRFTVNRQTSSSVESSPQK